VDQRVYGFGAVERAEPWARSRAPGVIFVMSDAFFGSIQGDPRYAAFLARLKLPPD